MFRKTSAPRALAASLPLRCKKQSTSTLGVPLGAAALNQMSEEELLALEKQLSNPEGEAGIETGKMMHRTNLGMTRRCIQALKLQQKDNILELGHGACLHLDDILGMATELAYTGLEVSETMCLEAVMNNKELMRRSHTLCSNHRYLEGKRGVPQQVRFDVFDGLSLPPGMVQEAHEDPKTKKYSKVLNVNCVYFWEKPVELLAQLRSIMREEKDGGSRLVFGMASKEYIEEKLPFARERFRNRFTPREFEEFALQGGFEVAEFETIEERVATETEGQSDTRPYHVGVLVPASRPQ